MTHFRGESAVEQGQTHRSFDMTSLPARTLILRNFIIFYHILPTILDSFPLDAILDSAFHAIAPLNLLCYLWLVFRNQLRSRVSEVLLRDVHCIRGRSLIQQPLG